MSAGLATRPIQGGRPTPYAAAVLAVVDRIPRGKVMSYGDVAEFVGSGSGRTVGAVMSRHGHEVPWHRVVQSTGGPNPASRRWRRCGCCGRDARRCGATGWTCGWPDGTGDRHGETTCSTCIAGRWRSSGGGCTLSAPDQWGCPTPCADWEVRNLVNHLVSEQLWVPPLLAGKRVADLGAGFAAGDVLGADPVAAWDAAAAAAASAAFAGRGALERTVHLSYADRPGEEYAREMVFDLVVHSWDLARGISARRDARPRPGRGGVRVRSSRTPTSPPAGCSTSRSRCRPTRTSRPD